MDVYSAVKNRRSVRRFKKEPFAEETLEKLLDAARLAPSAGNAQPWQFIVVRNRNTMARLADAALGQSWMLSAPLMVVVCAELKRSAASYGRRGVELYAIQDTAAAIENMLLCAVAEGLAACWVGAFREEAAASALGIDSKTLRPVALIPIGYPAERSSMPPKRPLDDVVQYVD